MQRCPTPIVMISSSNGDSERRSIQALAAGALTVVRKPLSLGRGVDEQDRVNFLTMLRLMAGVRVVTRFPSRGPADHDEQPAVSAQETEKEPVLRRTPAPGSPQLLAIAASTGGPAAMQAVLNGLGRAYPLPVLVVQHIARGFVAALVDWLRSTTPMPIHIAAHDERLLPGHAYLAPDDHHLLVVSRGTVGLRRCTPADRYCPSADMLFTSVADSYGARAIGVIMTGMGDDGASGLHRLRRAGAPTLAQDEASCVVFGMPHAAIRAGAVMQVEALTNLAPTVLALTGGSARACAG
jgi:two-component system chemotaxis response regulator CheB